MNKQELQEVLDLHKVWLDTKGKEGERADLRKADLEEADLQGAYLREADLREAYLQGAYLREANLTGANLEGAYLREANLEGADLGWAKLGWAKLGWVDLYKANLEGADLRYADLFGSDLEWAKGIYSVGPMPMSGCMVYFVKHKDCIMVQAGCFWGNTEELEGKAKDENEPWYLDAIRLAKKVLN